MEKYKTYSVYVKTNDNRTGTGVIFYKKEWNNLYIVTCAHVIYNAESATISILKDDFQDEIVIQAANNQFRFFSLDEVKDFGNNVFSFKYDIAAIECSTEGYDIQPSDIAIYPMKEGDDAIAVGYPLHITSPLYYFQDSINCHVERLLDNRDDFVVRITDEFINHSDREEDLKGFSGSPLWEKDNINKQINLLGGIVSGGMDTNISRARILIIKSILLRSFMKEEFGINIETRIPTVSESEIAPGYIQEYDMASVKRVRHSWIDHERKKAQTYIDNLQLTKGLQICDEVVQNSEFAKCDNEEKYSIYALMLEVHRIACDYDEFEALSNKMHSEGISNEDEVLIKAVRYFEALDLDNAEKYINEALKLNPLGNRESVFHTAIQVYKNETADITILSDILGSNDQLMIKPNNKDEEELIYQILGFVLSNRFHDDERAIRCLNRSYSIGGHFLILEALANAYYSYSLRNAYIDKQSDQINRYSIDMSALDKARDAYLRILFAADELYLKGMIKRSGLCMFKCFYFSNDNFRVYKHYHDLIKYLYPFADNNILRDVQICYLETAIRKEKVDLSKYEALTPRDNLFFELLTMLNENRRMIESYDVDEKQLAELLNRAEDMLADLIGSPGDGRIGFDGIHSMLINYYGSGILKFHWKAFDKVKEHYQEITNEKDKLAIELYVDELLINDYTLSEKKYKERFESERDVVSYNEWCKFYIRHGKPEKALKLYNRVFSEQNDLIKTQDEFFFREYVAFVLKYGYDLRLALECFENHIESFKDGYIKMLCEIDLNFAACIFNNPDEMVDTLKSLMEQELISERDYNSKCLIINMLNCRQEQAENYLSDECKSDPIKYADKYERMLLIWKGYSIVPNPHWHSMKHLIMNRTNFYDPKEDKTASLDEIIEKCNLVRRKTIVTDLWALYILKYYYSPEDFRRFDKIYITHNTMSSALVEIANVDDDDIRQILNFIQNENNICIQSPSLAEQLEIRRSEEFTIFHNTLLMAELKDCPALIGEFRYPIPKRFRCRVIRPNDFEKVISYMDKQKIS